MTIQPVVPNLVGATRALENKYTLGGNGALADPSAVITALNSLPQGRAYRPATTTNVLSPLALYDQARANRGLSPLTTRQTAQVLKTLQTQQPATPPRRQGFLSSALSDLRALVGGIPKLPISIYNEVQKLPDVPGEAAEAVARADNPLQAVGNLAAVPGIRMIPGTFVANQLLGDRESGAQGGAGLLAHPLFTALDLLPAAEAAAATRPVVAAERAAVTAANEAKIAQAVELTGAAGNARIAPRPNALRTALTKKLEGGEVVSTNLGKLTGGATEAFFSTPTGRAFQATFKERDLPRLESRYTAALRAAPDQAAAGTLPARLGTRGIEREGALLQHADAIKAAIDDANLPPGRSDELFRLADDPDAHGVLIPEQLPGLTDKESAILTEIRGFQDERARITEGDLTRQLVVNGRAEVFDLPTASKITGARRVADTAREHVAAREAVFNPASLGADPVARRDAILSRIDDVAARQAGGALNKGTAELLIRTYNEALDEAGWLRDEQTGVLSQVARPSMDDLTVALRPLERRYPTIPRLIDHLKNARWSEARRDLDSFSQTRAGGVLVDQLPFDIDGLKTELSRQIKRDRTLARTSRYTPKRLERAESVVAKVERDALPARFVSTAQRKADEAITERVREVYSGSPDLDRFVDMAANRVYGPLTEITTAEVRALQREARASTQALADAGLDPIFFSRVSPQARQRLPYIRVSDSPVTPAAARARMWDATPFQTDMGVALTSDAMQLLQRRGVEGFLDEFETTYGRRRGDLEAELFERAKSRASATPGISAQSHLATLMDERWAPWDASKFGGKRTSPALSISGRDTVMVPRVMAENMERLFTPPLPKLTAAFDPVMKVFRTAVLPLAPRWHIYNTIGGAVMTAVQDPAAFRYLPEIISEMWGSRKAAGGAGARAPHIEGAPPAGFGTVPAEVRAWDAEVRATSPIKDRLAASHNYAAGRTLSNWFNSAREGRLGKITDGAKRAVEKSYTANQMVDDMYRSAIGTSTRRRALAKSATAEMADAAAVASIRRVFQSWDEMTPMERSIMRAVVPFYGWSSHILKYAMRYPFDHPLRVAVLGSLARAELADAATGLPEYIRDMVLIGDTRANGIVKGLNVGPFNPFRDVGSFFTTAGFLGNLNPILTGVLESVGVNVQQGGPSLYPETRYDPETGRLVADPKGNLGSNILGNVLPQTELLTALVGRNESFNATLQRDPEAAGRLLLSNLGVPVLFRDINVGEQLIRSELARMEDQDTARKEALSTGNLSMLQDFPGLNAYAAQVMALEDAGELDQLRPESGQPGAPSGAGIAYAAQVALLGQ